MSRQRQQSSGNCTSHNVKCQSKAQRGMRINLYPPHSTDILHWGGFFTACTRKTVYHFWPNRGVTCPPTARPSIINYSIFQPPLCQRKRNGRKTVRGSVKCRPVTLRADPSAYYILIVLQFFWVAPISISEGEPRGAIPKSNKTPETVASDFNHKLCR